MVNLNYHSIKMKFLSGFPLNILCILSELIRIVII